jgi:hypothetical protein
MRQHRVDDAMLVGEWCWMTASTISYWDVSIWHDRLQA